MKARAYCSAGLDLKTSARKKADREQPRAVGLDRKMNAQCGGDVVWVTKRRSCPVTSAAGGATMQFGIAAA